MGLGFSVHWFASLFPPPGRVWPEGSSQAVCLVNSSLQFCSALTFSDEFCLTVLFNACWAPRPCFPSSKLFFFQSVLFLLTFLYNSSTHFVYSSFLSLRSKLHKRMAGCSGTAQGPVAEGEMRNTHLHTCVPPCVYVESTKCGKQADQSKPFKASLLFIFYVF